MLCSIAYADVIYLIHINIPSLYFPPHVCDLAEELLGVFGRSHPWDGPSGHQNRKRVYAHSRIIS